MDSLRAMFPDLDPTTLQATLDAHEGSVERTVDYLLSSHQPNNERASHQPNNERASQEQQDAELARRLQAEDVELFDQQQNFQQSMNNGGAATTHDDNNPNSFGLPSLADVQSAVQPIVNGVAYAGRVAANSVSGLYRELVGDEATNPSSQRRSNNMHHSQDESIVLRNEGSSPATTRSSARQRRPENPTAGPAFGDKKDD